MSDDGDRKKRVWRADEVRALRRAALAAARAWERGDLVEADRLLVATSAQAWRMRRHLGDFVSAATLHRRPFVDVDEGEA